MHFEILVEDQSGKKALDNLVPKIIGDEHTFNVHPYKGMPMQASEYCSISFPDCSGATEIHLPITPTTIRLR